jgi:hypothetical protein
MIYGDSPKFRMSSTPWIAHCSGLLPRFRLRMMHERLRSVRRPVLLLKTHRNRGPYQQIMQPLLPLRSVSIYHRQALAAEAGVPRRQLRPVPRFISAARVSFELRSPQPARLNVSTIMYWNRFVIGAVVTLYGTLLLLINYSLLPEDRRWVKSLYHRARQRGSVKWKIVSPLLVVWGVYMLLTSSR